MEEKNHKLIVEDHENDFDNETNLYDMPRTSSLLENYRPKLKENEIRRRELKKRIKVSESSQTEITSFFQISHKMALKLVFIIIFALAFVTIFVWHISAYINARRHDDLTNIFMKGKLDELENLKNEMRQCQNANGHLLREIQKLEEQFDVTVEVFDGLNSKSENIFFQIAVSILNAFFTCYTLLTGTKIVDKKVKMSRSTRRAAEFIMYIVWGLCVILIHYLNSKVDISLYISCTPIFCSFIVCLCITVYETKY